MDFLGGEADQLIAEDRGRLHSSVQSRVLARPAPRFKDFRWRTRTSCRTSARWWRRQIEQRDEADPRFIVASARACRVRGGLSYEKDLLRRGDMENRIEVSAGSLCRSAPASTAAMQQKSAGLWFASMAYVLLCALHHITLRRTPFAKASLPHRGAPAAADQARRVSDLPPHQGRWRQRVLQPMLACAAQRLAAAADARRRPPDTHPHHA